MIEERCKDCQSYYSCGHDGVTDIQTNNFDKCSRFKKTMTEEKITKKEARAILFWLDEQNGKWLSSNYRKTTEEVYNKLSNFVGKKKKWKWLKMSDYELRTPNDELRTPNVITRRKKLTDKEK